MLKKSQARLASVRGYCVEPRSFLAVYLLETILGWTKKGNQWIEGRDYHVYDAGFDFELGFLPANTPVPPVPLLWLTLDVEDLKSTYEQIQFLGVQYALQVQARMTGEGSAEVYIPNVVYFGLILHQRKPARAQIFLDSVLEKARQGVGVSS